MTGGAGGLGTGISEVFNVLSEELYGPDHDNTLRRMDIRPKSQVRLQPGEEYFRANIMDEQLDWGPILDDVDVVIHALMAPGPPQETWHERCIDLHGPSTEVLCDQMVKHDVGTIVVDTSLNRYENPAYNDKKFLKGRRMTERFKRNATFGYGLSKVHEEEVAERYAEKHGMKVGIWCGLSIRNQKQWTEIMKKGITNWENVHYHDAAMHNLLIAFDPLKKIWRNTNVQVFHSAQVRPDSLVDPGKSVRMLGYKNLYNNQPKEPAS